MKKFQQKRKPNKPNGFFTFALEFKQKMIEKQHDILNIRQVMELASPHWEKLSSDEKERYKEKSKYSEEESTSKPQKRKRYDCFGKTDELQLNLDSDQDNYEEMVREIKDLVMKASDLNELDTEVFYFVSTTSFYDSTVKAYAAELAMAKFSLKEGIIDDFQVRINPGELSLGAFSTAQEKSLKTHRYPLPPDCDGEKDYTNILELMMKFLHPLDKLPIFFTEGNTREDRVPLQETCKIVDKILYESEEDDLISDLKVYPIDELLFMLHKMTSITKNRRNGTFERPIPSVPFAANLLQSNNYQYTTKGCEFHEELDVAQHCCLSKVRRYGYTLAKWCSNDKSYELKSGKHFPETHDCL